MILKPINATLFLLGAAQILWLPGVSASPLFPLTAGLLLLGFIHLKYQQVRSLLFFLAGLLYALLACQLQLQQQLQSPKEADLLIRIEGLPKVAVNKISFIATDIQTNRTWLLNHYLAQEVNTKDYQSGAMYAVKVRLKPPHGTVNGVGFDREKWLFRQGIDGIGSIQSMAMAPNQSEPSFNINRWRMSLSKLINQHFEKPATNALVHALSIGDKSHFEQQDHRLFQHTGTAHLIAISGLHIGMVALIGWGVGSLLFRFFPQQRFSKPWFQFIAGFVLATFYAGLAGFAVSTQRALIMLFIYGLFKLSNRPSYAWDVWAASLLVILLIDPLQVIDAGFWLSFTAVAVLILSFNGVQSKPSKTLGFIKMQLTVLVGMLPLSLAIFSRVNLLAPLVNLIMIPLMTFALIPLLMLLLLFGTLLQVFPEFLVNAINSVSQLLLFILNWFYQFADFALSLSINHWWQYIALIVGAALLTLPKAIPQRFWGAILIVLGLIPNNNQPPAGHFKAHFLDVGQGLSVLLETENHAALYDVGAAYDSGFNMVDATVLPFLQQQNITHLDALILSHQDNDHAGASSQLTNALPISVIWGTEDHHQACLAGQKWTWDGVEFTFLSPLNLTPYLHNNSSCVLKVQNHNSSLLLTGDMEAPVEFRLIQMNQNNLSADVLLMPHHGSKTSSTVAFIEAVGPKYAINSSGQYNSFNHPAAAILKRYDQQHIPVIDTQSSGLITLATHPSLQIKSWRQEHPRIWRKKKPE